MKEILTTLSKVWKYFILLLTLALFLWLCYGLYFISITTNVTNLFLIEEEKTSVLIAGFGILSIVLSFLIGFYINLTKKDDDIQACMGGLENRTVGYQSQVAFWKNGGPTILIYYLDIGGHLLLPFIQKRKNYKDINILTIPLAKKIPFILVWLSLILGILLFLVAFIYMPSDEEQFVIKEKRYRTAELDKKQNLQTYDKCVDANELCMCFFTARGKYSDEVVPCRNPNGSIKMNKSGLTHFKLTEKRLQSAGLNINEIFEN